VPVDTVVLCQKAASCNNSSTKLEPAERQAKQCAFTGVDGNTLQQRIATTRICHKEASLNNSTGEIKSAERQRGNEMAKVQVESQ